MKKLNTLKYVALAVILSVMTINNVQAFLFLPPMPPEPVVDAPDIATKILSQVQAIARKALTIKTELSTGKLNALKGAINKFGIDPKQLLKSANLSKSNSPKTPGENKVAASTKLGIGSGKEALVNEEDYANAYRKLFLTEPSWEDYKPVFKLKDSDDYALSAQDVTNRAYRNKRIAYQQDRIIQTYIYARMMEDYLSLVEKTVERMGPCIDNDIDESKCVFFGLQMKKMDSTQEAPEPGKPSAGELGQVRNAYIVSTLYDRLMRIVETMSAQEAIFRASEQLDVTEPARVDNQSSAEEYINNKYHFAYKENYTHMAARNIINCYDGTPKKGCPNYSKEVKKDGEVNENPAIMNDFDQIEQKLDKVMEIHNLKVQLPTYKTEYRQYLKAQEIHARALQALKDSDSCVLNFFKLYGDKKKANVSNWGSYWGNYGVQANDYDKRKGVSRDLILAFDKVSENTIIGTSPQCENYYSVCKDGYRLDKENPCEDDSSLFPCVLDTIELSNTADIEGDGTEGTGSVGSFTGVLSDHEEMSEDDENKYRNNPLISAISFETTDHLRDASKEDSIEKENRIQKEQTWQIGSEKMMRLTEEGILKFAPWNDQEAMQEEYLYHKYNNMKKIIQSIDTGINGYKVAKDLVDNRDMAYDQQILKEISELLNKWQHCPGPDSSFVRQKAESLYYDWTDQKKSEYQTLYNKNPNRYRNFWCKEYKGNPNVSNGTLEVTGRCYYEELDDGDWETRKSEKYERTYYQIAANEVEGKTVTSCNFVQDSLPAQEITMTSKDYCHGGIWDLTPNYLVKGFFNILGGCATDVNVAADKLYSDTHAKERVVAQDMLLNVMNTRTQTEQDLINFVKAYDQSQKARKDQLERYKLSMNSYNKEINDATSKENKIKEELKLTERRIKNIGDSKNPAKGTELAIINDRIAKRSGDKEYACALSIEKAKLNFERDAISGVDSKNLEWKLPKECASLSAEKKRSIGFNESDAPQREDYVISMTDFKNRFMRTQTKGLTRVITKEPYKTVDGKRLSLPEAKQEIALLEGIIKRNDNSRKAIQNNIKALTEQMEAAAEAFADSYIDKAEENQTIVENANQAYEEFLNNDWHMKHATHRICVSRFMGICTKHGPKTYYKDNLGATIAAFNKYGDKDVEYDEQSEYEEEVLPEVKKVAEKVINANIINAKADEIINQLVGKFSLDGHFVVKTDNIKVFGRAIEGSFTAKELFDIIKDQIMEMAKREIAEKIKTADQTIEQEKVAAINKVDGVARSLGVVDNAVPNSAIFKHENYASADALIIKKHQSLLSSLRQPTTDYFKNKNVNMSGIFGIPADGELVKEIGTVKPDNTIVNKDGKKIGKANIESKVAYNNDGIIIGTVDGNKVYNLKEDNEYFVALPARGNNYLGKQESDVDAGRDYMFPKRPLMNMPPVREVFYYNSADFNDTPKTKRKRKAKYFMPSLSYLLDKKYPGDKEHQWEYMPEVWRYLLASPNMRNDGKYQQTFVEKTMAGATLKKLIDNTDKRKVPNADVKNYRTIIGRGGVYPCKIGNEIFDMGMSKNDDSVAKMQYKLRVLPKGYTYSDIPVCREIGLNRSGTSLCQKYNNKKKGICNLQATHGKYKDVQENVPATEDDMFDKYSELGQFLQGTLEYRPLQERILEYLISEDKDNIQNTINRQRAEQAVFARNLFGSFLDSVQTEYLTRKNVEKLSESIDDRLRSICEQYNQVLGKSVSGAKDESADDYKVCISYIKSNSGLAFSSEDRRYGIDGEYKDKKYNFGGINCSTVSGSGSSNYYEDMYCQLASVRQELLNEIKTQGIVYKDAKGKEKRTKPFNTYISKAKNKRGGITGVLKERYEFLKNYIDLLEADKDIVVYLTTEMDKSELTSDKIKTEKANRTAERVTDEEGLIAMDNQGQTPVYCPIYAYKKKGE